MVIKHAVVSLMVVQSCRLALAQSGYDLDGEESRY